MTNDRFDDTARPDTVVADLENTSMAILLNLRYVINNIIIIDNT